VPKAKQFSLSIFQSFDADVYWGLMKSDLDFEKVKIFQPSLGGAATTDELPAPLRRSGMQLSPG